VQSQTRDGCEGEDRGGCTGDLSKISAFFTEDAIYSWNTDANWEFVARGRQQRAKSKKQRFTIPSQVAGWRDARQV
jgi:hypothetical protein